MRHADEQERVPGNGSVSRRAADAPAPHGADTYAALTVNGGITAESFGISGPRGVSVQDDSVDCLVYGTDNDVYHVQITFAKGE